MNAIQYVVQHCFEFVSLSSCQTVFSVLCSHGVCMCACVRACMRACVRACACVCVCMSVCSQEALLVRSRSFLHAAVCSSPTKVFTHGLLCC